MLPNFVHIRYVQYAKRYPWCVMSVYNAKGEVFRRWGVIRKGIFQPEAQYLWSLNKGKDQAYICSRVEKLSGKLRQWPYELAVGFYAPVWSLPILRDSFLLGDCGRLGDFYCQIKKWDSRDPLLWQDEGIISYLVQCQPCSNIRKAQHLSLSSLIKERVARWCRLCS